MREELGKGIYEARGEPVHLEGERMDVGTPGRESNAETAKLSGVL